MTWLGDKAVVLKKNFELLGNEVGILYDGSSWHGFLVV